MPMGPPPIAGNVDLRDFPWMPLEVSRVRSSDLIHESGDVFRAAVLLWCASWHQIPAGSLPMNDRVLAGICGFHYTGDTAPRAWASIREGALRGFQQYDDGRLYHAVIVKHARDAWGRKMAHEAEQQQANIKRQQARERKRKQRERERLANGGTYD